VDCIGTSQEKRRPAASDSLFDQWELENSLVMSLLINSIQILIAYGYLLLDSSLKIWNVAF
jgi:hypothetical protein